MSKVCMCFLAKVDCFFDESDQMFLEVVKDGFFLKNLMSFFNLEGLGRGAGVIGVWKFAGRVTLFDFLAPAEEYILI